MRISVMIFLVLMILALSLPVMGDMEAVRTGYGSLIIGGVFQSGFTYHMGDEIVDFDAVDLANGGQLQAADRGPDGEFLIHFARLSFKGMIIDDKVRYFVQLDLNPEDPDAVGPLLLDAKIGLKYIPYTTLWMGRFAPNFTYFNPLNVAHLGLIDYPLMNQHMGVQRQSGINADIVHKWFEFNLGATNGLSFNNYTYSVNPPDRQGAGVGNDDWGDENTMKDVFVSAAVKPIHDLRIWGGYWYGRPLDFFEENPDGELDTHNVKMGIANAGLAYFARFGLSIMGEFMYSWFKYDNNDADNNNRDEDYLDFNTMSYYARLGFNMKNLVGVPVELMGQYDWIDPDRTNDKDTHGYEDERRIITGGLNYYIKDWHAMVAVNYLYKDEMWKVIPKDGKDEQTGIDDDELKVQLQVAF